MSKIYRDNNVAVKYFTSFLENQITFMVKESSLPTSSKIKSQRVDFTAVQLIDAARKL